MLEQESTSPIKHCIASYNISNQKSPHHMDILFHNSIQHPDSTELQMLEEPLSSSSFDVSYVDNPSYHLSTLASCLSSCPLTQKRVTIT